MADVESPVMVVTTVAMATIKQARAGGEIGDKTHMKGKNVQHW